MRRLAEEWASGANRFDGAGEAFFAALIGGRVIGVCGSTSIRIPRRRGSAGCGICISCWPIGASGLAGKLVSRVIETARGRFDILRLSTQNPAAAQLYERLGFRRCVGAADCTHLMELR